MDLPDEDWENMLSLAFHGPCGQYLLLDQSGTTTLEVDCAVEDQGAASLVDSIPALIEDATRDLPNIDQITWEVCTNYAVGNITTGARSIEIAFDGAHIVNRLEAFRDIAALADEREIPHLEISSHDSRVWTHGSIAESDKDVGEEIMQILRARC